MKNLFLLFCIFITFQINAQSFVQPLALKRNLNFQKSNESVLPDNKKIKGFWIEFGLAGSNLLKEGFGGGVGIAVQNGRHLISFRYLVLGEYDFDIFGGDNVNESMIELSSLYGLSVKNKVGYLAASAGLSYTKAVRQGRFLYSEDCGGFCEEEIYKEEHIKTLGFPIQMEVGLTPLPMLGFSYKATYNINPRKNYYTSFFTIQFGNLGFADQ